MLPGVQVDWKPYQIDPSTDEQGEDMEAYCRRRWGSSGWTNHLRQQGRADGNAQFANWKYWPNTLRSHQWIQYGMEKYNLSSDELNSVLFNALYEQGINISSVDELVQLGRDTFPSFQEQHQAEQQLRDYLQNNLGAAQVQREIRKYRVQGVPYFVVERNGARLAQFSGAQSTAYLRNLLHDAVNGSDDDDE